MSLKQFPSVVTLAGIILGFSGFHALQVQWGEKKPYVLKPTKEVYPVYPEHLKKEGIAGEVIVSVSITDKGDVIFRNTDPFQIRRRLHPVLDKLAMEVVKQWKFEPINVFDEKVSRMPAFLSIIFDPGEYIDPSESVAPEPLSEEMIAFLYKCWAYNKKYEEIADYYICRERIRERICKLDLILGSAGAMGNEKVLYSPVYYLPKLGETSRITLFNEYQILSRDNRLREVRIPVEPPADKRDAQFG
jgi:TonB family protein